MAVFRVERTRDYTVMSNHHLKNRDLTLKSKGLLSFMLSLPEDWNYTTRGLAAICNRLSQYGMLHVDLSPVRDLVSLQRRCSNNLNQIAINANTYGIYPQEISALQRDYTSLWEPLSDLLKQLAKIVKL